MLEMKTGFTLSPVIRRLGQCGHNEREPHHSTASSDGKAGPQLQSPGEVRRNERSNNERPSSLFRSRGAQKVTNTERVRTFVNGIVGPFAACLQPSSAPCAGGACEPPEHAFGKKPALVTPHTNRAIPYRDSRFEHEHEGAEEPPRYRLHYRQRSSPPPPPPPSSYPHAHSAVNASAAATTAAVGAVPSPVRSNRGLAVESGTVGDPCDESNVTTAYDKKRRSTDIAKPRSNDILCGRGGSSNRHLGNIQFRELVAANKQVYVGLTKKQKMLVARKIVDAIHRTGGRFLAKDMDTGLFYDIGLPRSLEKTSQALREKHSNEMSYQSAENEGIETTVEFHNQVIQNESKATATDTKQAAGESPAGASCSTSKTTSKSAKSSEAPPLIIPSHLMKLFGPKGSKGTEPDWENHHHSPTKHSGSDPVYDGYHYSYPHSPYSRMVPESPVSHYNRAGYPPVPGHPSPTASHPMYPSSPVPPYPSHYRPHPSHHHYYYQRHQGHPPHSPHSPHYGWHGRVPDDRHMYPPPVYDEREAYSSEQYPGPTPTEYDPAITRSPPHHGHGKPPSSPGQYPPYPGRHVSSRHHGPPPLPLQPGHGPSPGRMRYRSFFSPVRYWSEDVPPVPHPSPRTIYRNANNGYVRGTPDVSPSRQREMKRQRNGEALADASLSSAVSKSLSLDERVVGREREQQMRHRPPLEGRSSINGALEQTGSGSSPAKLLVSPSSMLQSSARTRARLRGSVLNTGGRDSPTEKKEDLSTLSGLAALSTAAFLKLDEDEAKK